MGTKDGWDVIDRFFNKGNKTEPLNFSKVLGSNGSTQKTSPNNQKQHNQSNEHAVKNTKRSESSKSSKSKPTDKNRNLKEEERNNKLRKLFSNIDGMSLYQVRNYSPYYYKFNKSTTFPTYLSKCDNEEYIKLIKSTQSKKTRIKHVRLDNLKFGSLNEFGQDNDSIMLLLGYYFDNFREYGALPAIYVLRVDDKNYKVVDTLAKLIFFESIGIERYPVREINGDLLGTFYISENTLSEKKSTTYPFNLDDFYCYIYQAVKENKEKYNKYLEMFKREHIFNAFKARSIQRFRDITSNKRDYVLKSQKYKCAICGFELAYNQSDEAEQITFDKVYLSGPNIRVRTKLGVVITPNPAFYSLDHIVPIKAGGDGGMRNVMCLCRICNETKGWLLYTRELRKVIKQTRANNIISIDKANRVLIGPGNIFYVLSDNYTPGNLLYDKYNIKNELIEKDVNLTNLFLKGIAVKGETMEYELDSDGYIGLTSRNLKGSKASHYVDLNSDNLLAVRSIGDTNRTRKSAENMSTNVKTLLLDYRELK